jgi:Spx/MgsR family transcriptional regulator
VSDVPVLYGLDNCDTCRKARNWLKRAGVEHGFVDYRAQRIEPATLKAWAQQLGGWDALINKASTTWKNLPPMRKTPGSDPEWTLLIKEHPAIVKRPVVAMPDGGVQLGFTQGNFEKLFGTKAK